MKKYLTFRNAHIIVLLYPITLQIGFPFVSNSTQVLIKEHLKTFTAIYTTLCFSIIMHAMLATFVLRLSCKLIFLYATRWRGLEVESPSRSESEKQRAKERVQAEWRAFYVHAAMQAVTVMNMAVFTRVGHTGIAADSLANLHSIIASALFSGLCWRIPIGVAHGIGRLLGRELIKGLFASRRNRCIASTTLLILLPLICRFTSMTDIAFVRMTEAYMSIYATWFWVDAINFLYQCIFGTQRDEEDRWTLLGTVMSTAMAFFFMQDAYRDLGWVMGTILTLWRMLEYGMFILLIIGIVIMCAGYLFLTPEQRAGSVVEKAESEVPV
uniref:Uncharacterized protein n=1 Tax=Moniliophthora roreri TaxID=221103 RepID=A0A0W0FE25_MONRR